MNFVENIPCIPRYHVTDTNNGKYSVRLKLRIYRFYKRHPLVTNKELRIKFGIKNRSTITKIISGRDMIIKEHYS